MKLFKKIIIKNEITLKSVDKCGDVNHCCSLNVAERMTFKDWKLIVKIEIIHSRHEYHDYNF